MKSRSELREIIVTIMYQKYIYDNGKISYNIEEIIKENLETENEFINSSVNGIIENEEKITFLANKYLNDWTIDRLSKVDKAVICLGIYELIFTETPPIVAINEAIELAKKFSDEKVVNMINAVLDNVYHNEVEGKDEW